MNQSNKSASLIELLETNGRLSLLEPNEIEWLNDPSVVELSAQEQWDFISNNRKVSFWTGLFGGGLRLLILFGAVIALFVFALVPDALAGVQDQETKLVMIGFGVLLLGASLYLMNGFVRNVRQYEPLPEFTEMFY